MTDVTRHNHRLIPLGIVVLLCCFSGCGDGSADSQNTGPEATQQLVNTQLNCAFSVPKSWNADRDIYSADIQATAPAPTATGYSPNIRLVASKLADGQDLQSYWTQNRDEVLAILPQCKMTGESTVTLENGHETRQAVFTFVNQNSIPLAMYVCAFTYGGRGYTLTGLVPTEDADAYAPIFTAAFNSLNFN